jgi:hypothetical protein
VNNLQTGLQLDVTRRSSRPIHTDALDLVSAGILCPVLLEHVERSVFITEAGRRVAPGHDGATRCGFATWTDIQLRRAVNLPLYAAVPVIAETEVPGSVSCREEFEGV